MSGTEELLSRLQRLEDSYYGDRESARQAQFFDTYGSRFSNNRGLGLAILNELDARGIDTSAADEAVTQILDQLRTECNEIIESIKVVQEAAIENAQKVEQVADVVSQASAENPEAVMSNAAQPSVEPAEMPPEMQDAEQPNFEGIGMPEGDMPPAATEQAPEGDMPPAATEQAPEGDMPPAATEQAPEGDMPPAEPEQADTEVTSDVRMKRITRMKAAFGNKQSRSFKPSKGLISACGGNV